MTTLFRSINASWVLLSLISLAISAGLLYSGFAFELKSPDWAAWVQAIGSIAAILASVAITNYQIRKEHAIERSREAAANLRIANFACAVVNGALENIQMTRQEQMRWPNGAPYRYTCRSRIQSSLDLIRTVVTEPLSDELIDPVIAVHDLLTEVNYVSEELVSMLDPQRHSRFDLHWKNCDARAEAITNAISVALLSAHGVRQRYC